MCIFLHFQQAWFPKSCIKFVYIFQNIYETCVSLIVKDWEGCCELEVMERVESIIVNLNIMNQLFNWQNTQLVLQTIHDILLDARTTYDTW